MFSVLNVYSFKCISCLLLLWHYILLECTSEPSGWFRNALIYMNVTSWSVRVYQKSHVSVYLHKTEFQHFKVRDRSAMLLRHERTHLLCVLCMTCLNVMDHGKVAFVYACAVSAKELTESLYRGTTARASRLVPLITGFILLLLPPWGLRPSHLFPFRFHSESMNLIVSFPSSNIVGWGIMLQTGRTPVRFPIGHWSFQFT
jgi:hypothetical protein